MKKLAFESTEEFNEYFKGKNLDLTNTIMQAIRVAEETKKKTAYLFEISFEGMETMFDISLTRSQWVLALENCLSHYEEWELGDEAIDTYLLIKKIKS